MKKIILLFICLLLVGCQEKIETIYKLDNNLYKVNTPYKEPVSNYSKESYNKKNVEKMLMEISEEYFSNDLYVFEEGQYLTKENIIELLKNMQKDVIAIYEQNYISNDSKAISIAIVINNLNYDDTYNDIKYLENHLNSLCPNHKLLITVYKENDSLLEGNIIYIYDGEMNYVNYNYQFLDSNYILNNDLQSYNAFLDIKSKITDNDIYITGVGLYKDKLLEEVVININNNYLSTSQILYISQNITASLNNFIDQVEVKVNFNSGEDLKALLIKKEGFLVDLQILEG